MRDRRLLLASLLLASTVTATARAQPKFEFEKPPEKPSAWQVQAKGGLLITSGNSQSRNGNLGVTATQQTGYNKLSFDANVAYGRSEVLVPVIEMNMATGTNVVTGLVRSPETTTNQWKARGRYDRFFTPNNSGYVLGQIGADRVAGKKLVGGGQAGYSRQLVKSDSHTTVAELGYDFSYESYLADPPVDAVAIHSARVFVGELWKLTSDTGITGGLEALFNLNKEKAPDARDPTGATNEVKAFKDTRLIGKLGLTTTLYKSLSFGFGFTVRYDQNPAPRPVPASAKGAKYAPDFHPFADKLDTLTEATLVFTFL
ncbi:MAG TPA: DUF481 domain-containing protein [Polyangia bacterium]|nr:DUF481 domain-containing protein [Polyangia bacterium]